MILETLDVKQNDIFIYSENKFDLEENFKLINKDEKIKKPISIHFNDVCAFIYDEKPKSIVVYRLLTNFPSFNSSLVKYGIIVNINSAPEVIYFDPVYALRELDEYTDLQYFNDLRFRIQQVGLMSSYRFQGEANFQEVYAFDLEATEVEFQNDRVFAELIFAFDDIDFDRISSYRDTMHKEKEEQTKRFNTLSADDFKSGISEEAEYKGKEGINRRDAVIQTGNIEGKTRMQRVVTVMAEKPNPNPSTRPAFKPAAQPKPEKSSNDQPAQTPAGQKAKQNFGDFLSKVKNESPIEQNKPDENQKRVIDLFKSTSGMQDFVVEREKKQVVLKFKKGGG